MADEDPFLKYFSAPYNDMIASDRRRLDEIVGERQSLETERAAIKQNTPEEYGNMFGSMLLPFLAGTLSDDVTTGLGFGALGGKSWITERDKDDKELSDRLDLKINRLDDETKFYRDAARDAERQRAGNVSQLGLQYFTGGVVDTVPYEHDRQNKLENSMTLADASRSASGQPLSETMRKFWSKKFNEELPPETTQATVDAIMKDTAEGRRQAAEAAKAAGGYGKQPDKELKSLATTYMTQTNSFNEIKKVVDANADDTMLERIVKEKFPQTDRGYISDMLKFNAGLLREGIEAGVMTDKDIERWTNALAYGPLDTDASVFRRISNFQDVMKDRLKNTMNVARRTGTFTKELEELTGITTDEGAPEFPTFPARPSAPTAPNSPSAPTPPGMDPKYQDPAYLAWKKNREAK